MVRSISVVLVLAVGAVFLGGCSGGGGSDNNAILSFLNNSFSVNEDGTPIAQITLTRTGNTTNNVSVTVFLTDGTATGGPPPLFPPSDYDNTAIVVTWNAGDVADKVINVAVLDDHQDEPDETVNLTLGNLSGGASFGAVDTAVLTIVDNDVAGRVQFSQANYFYGEDGTTGTQVTIERVGGMDGDITATIVSTDVTANSDPFSLVEPVDYNAINQTVMFADQVTTSVVIVPSIVQDLLPELDEDFALTIVSTTGGATIGAPSSTVVTIFDDDDSLEIPNPNTELNALFGHSVAKLGPTLAIGAPNSNAPAGVVNVFNVDFGTINFTLDEPFSLAYGTRVITDPTDDTLAVGATGSVYVYDSDGGGSSFRFSASSLQGGFGSTGIGLLDGRLAVGAPLAQLAGSVMPSGQVFIYNALTGSPLQTIDGVADNEFGSSFAFFGSALFIGSPGNTGTTSTHSGTPLTLGFVIPNPVPNGAAPSPSFGAAVASLGGTAIVGAPDEDTLVVDAGLIYLFDGGPAQAILAPGAFVAGGRFGAQIITIGNRIIVQQQGGGTSAAGRVFVLDSLGGLVQTIDDPNPSPNADFGASMCEFDGALVIGAPKQGFILQPGSVFIFKIF